MAKRTEKFRVSQSKVKLYQQCRFAYHKKYVEKLRKRKIKRPFAFGTLVHAMLEAQAKGKDPMKVLSQVPLDQVKMFNSEREMYGDILLDIRFIMTDYFRFWKNDGLITIKKGGVAAEHEFEIDLTKDIIFTGKIDRVQKTKRSGLRWLTEHKTFGRSIPKPDHLWRNLQSAVYLRAMQMLGWKPMDGILWDYIFSKPPSRIRITKSGAVSKAKMNTVPSAILHSLKQNKLDIDDHKQLIRVAESNCHNYFKRIYTPVNEEVVDQIFNGFIDTAREVADNHGKSQTRTFGRHCEYCDFEALCRAELTGADVDFIRKREYYVKKEEDDHIVNVVDE